MKNRFADYAHVLRLAAIAVIAVACFALLRTLFVPAGFGQYGHFRAGAIDDNRVRPIAFAGRATCAECHTDIVEARRNSRHERIGCEACHGPLAPHAAGESTTTPVLPDTRMICVRCHDAAAGKPASFPQVNVGDHAPDGACTICHQPHHPEIG
jgi:hypothetical protein